MRSIINEKNLNNKKILLRLDLNVPLDKGKITDTTRIDKIIPTLDSVSYTHLTLPTIYSV